MLVKKLSYAEIGKTIFQPPVNSYLAASEPEHGGFELSA